MTRERRSTVNRLLTAVVDTIVFICTCALIAVVLYAYFTGGGPWS